MLSWALRASACPSRGQILGCVLAPCAPGPALLDSRSWPYSCLTAEPPPKPLRVPPGAAQPLHMAPLPLQETPPPRCSRGRSNLYTQSHCWSLSVLLPGQCMCPAALRELGALSWECRSLLVSQGALRHPRPPGVLL